MSKGDDGRRGGGEGEDELERGRRDGRAAARTQRENRDRLAAREERGARATPTRPAAAAAAAADPSAPAAAVAPLSPRRAVDVIICDNSTREDEESRMGGK